MPRYFEDRRYAAVLLRDERLASSAAAHDAWRVAKARVRQLQFGDHPVSRVTYRAGKQYYPPGIERRPRDNPLDHEVYTAALQDAAGRRHLLVAAPYVRLLAVAVRELDQHVQGDEPLLFARPPMHDLFGYFEARILPEVTVSHIELSLGGSAVDRVTLSGRNPLRSDLRQAFLTVAKPYALRMRAQFDLSAQRTSVNVDRHGNLWWYLTRENSLGNVLPAVQLLLDQFQFIDSTDLPVLKRTIDAEEGLE